MEREKTGMYFVVQDLSCRYQCELMVFKMDGWIDDDRQIDCLINIDRQMIDKCVYVCMHAYMYRYGVGVGVCPQLSLLTVTLNTKQHTQHPDHDFKYPSPPIEIRTFWKDGWEDTS